MKGEGNDEGIRKYILKNDFRIDFNRLATQNQKLYEHLLILDHRTVLNFKNQQSLIVLTQAIMKGIFQVHWTCPRNSLCPRIPNRINYILWIHQYIQRQIKVVLDIGTGSTLIYPLLGNKLFQWKFISSQTNEKSIEHCKGLVLQNSLQNQIQVRKTQKNQFLCGVVQKSQAIDVVMCNPPFFDQNQDKEPLGVMKDNEFQTRGGQYEFFFSLYTESFQFSNIKIFTCLIGRFTDFEQIIQFLKVQNQYYQVLEELKFGEIHQGNNKRFIVMWKPKEHQLDYP